MTINIDEKLYKAVCGKYTSMEYIIGEILPTVSIANLISIVQKLPETVNTISIDISESIYNEIRSVVDDEYSVDEIANYLIGFGFVLEV